MDAISTCRHRQPTAGDIILPQQKFAILIMLHQCTAKNGLFVAVQWFKYT